MKLTKYLNLLLLNPNYHLPKKVAATSKQEENDLEFKILSVTA
jgi:hypothetical protein